MRFFNTAGPIQADDHYCLPPLKRFDLEDILFLINQKKYFVLHAPRQTGKTSCLLALMEYLNQEGKYKCLYINVEAAQAAREDVEGGMRAILSEMAYRINEAFEDTFLMDRFVNILEKSGGYGALTAVISAWAKDSNQPLVLLIDEIDALVGDTLISVLRQLRSGYDKRPQKFPQSIILCGVRDVRDYRIHSSKNKEIITGGSAFNIKAKSLSLGNFTQAEMEELYLIHTQETGQIFEKDALDLAWELTEGQPWLTNALAYETCFDMKENRDRSRAITAEIMAQAKENLIIRRETHLDQLTDKLQEERVRRVIGPILSGEEEPEQIPDDDISYVRDLGIVSVKKPLRIANQIYQEIIPRELTNGTQETITHEAAWYIEKDAQLNMAKLLKRFQEFFREHSEHWIERFQYKEAGPQLLLQAFLQRIINGGGRVEREYGLGRMRTDLLVIWFHPQGRQRIVIELKLLHKSLRKTIADGLKQTSDYMDRCGTQEGYLVIFDRSTKKPWSKKIFSRTETFNQNTINIFGM